jgi:hypothetical protein
MSLMQSGQPGTSLGGRGLGLSLLDCYWPEQQTRVQGMNDFAVFGSMVVGSSLSGEGS